MRNCSKRSCNIGTYSETYNDENYNELNFNKPSNYNTSNCNTSNYRIRSTLLICLSIFLLLFLSSCKKKNDYIVITWNNDDQWLKTDDVYQLKAENKTTSPVTYTIRSISCQKCEDVTIKEGKVFFERFNTLVKANTFKEKYKDYIDTFAQSQIENVKVRSEPNTTKSNNVLYRLAEGEKIKVLSKAIEDTILGRKDFWYNVLLENGIKGYVFGSEIFLLNNARTKLTKNEFDKTQYIFSKKWYPLYYKTMIDRGVYDLNLFNPNYGFSVSSNENAVIGGKDNSSISFDLSDIYKEGDFFVADNDKIKFRLLDNTTLQVIYKENQMVFENHYTFLDIDVRLIYENEILRRQNLLKDLGRYLSSKDYGFIEIAKNGEFKWYNADQLIPSIIPSGTVTSGEIVFEDYIADNLKYEYTNIITLYFTKENFKLKFIYRLSENGIYFYYFDKKLIENNYLPQEPQKLLTILFLKREISDKI